MFGKQKTTCSRQLKSASLIRCCEQICLQMTLNSRQWRG